MTTYLDTSALYALMDRAEERHQLVSQAWKALLDGRETLVLNNYVIVETAALIQRRLGMQPARDFVDNILPLAHVEWMDEASHLASVASMLAANRRDLSLVDCSSFHTMRQLRIETVFALDPHFSEQDFQVIPPEALYDQAQASTALQTAEQVLQRCERLVRELAPP